MKHSTASQKNIIRKTVQSSLLLLGCLISFNNVLAHQKEKNPIDFTSQKKIENFFSPLTAALELAALEANLSNIKTGSIAIEGGSFFRSCSTTLYFSPTSLFITLSSKSFYHEMYLYHSKPLADNPIGEFQLIQNIENTEDTEAFKILYSKGFVDLRRKKNNFYIEITAGDSSSKECKFKSTKATFDAEKGE